jgi:hypothetical protein
MRTPGSDLTDQSKPRAIGERCVSLILLVGELQGARIPQPEGTRVGLRERLPADRPMPWHARGREGWLAPDRVIMSNKNGGGEPPFPTTSMLLKVGGLSHIHRLSPMKPRNLPARAAFPTSVSLQ